MDIEKKRHGLISRLKRIEGQVRGLQRLLEDDTDCAKVAQQMTAARRALDRAFFETMACAMERELFESSEEKEEKRQLRVQRITGLMSKYS